MTRQEKVTFAIAEDEWIESAAMRRFIEDTFPEACVLWQESDGEQALEAVRREPPQILIVDIRMPVMDGLALCRALNDEGYDGLILINTAYDSFAYARQAISLHVFDYIVKPADNDELRETLSNCIAQVRRKALTRTRTQTVQATKSLNQLAIALLSDPQPEEKTARLCLETLGWDPTLPLETYVIHLLSSSPFSERQTDRLRQALDLFQSAGFLSVSGLMNPHHGLALLQSRSPMHPQIMYTLLWGFGFLCSQNREICVNISAACADSLAIMQEVAAHPTPGTATLTMPPRTWRLLPRREAEKYSRTLERMLYDEQFARAVRYIQNTLTGDPLLPWELVSGTLTSICRVWPNQDILPLIAPLYAQQSDPVACMLDWISQCQRFPSPDAGDVITRALQVMQTQYASDISQAALAEAIGLDQGYFSRLFKKKTGRNFSEVLLDIRMQHAEAMLRENHQCSLEELCRACGLSSKTYFSEAFKKWKGMTITQFLKTLSP